MDRDAVRDLVAGDQLESRFAGRGQLGCCRGPHDDDPRAGQLPPELERLRDGRDAERRRAGAERSPGAVERP